VSEFDRGHGPLSKDTATFQTRCKWYFSVKLRNHTKNCTDNSEGPVEISGTQVFFLKMYRNLKHKGFLGLRYFF